MKRSNFLLVFLVTIIALRTILYFIPRTSRIYTDNFHHIYFGLALLILYFFYKFPSSLLAFSLALIADQITQAPFYILNLMDIKTSQYLLYYWSPYAVISTTIIITISIILIKKWKN